MSRNDVHPATRGGQLAVGIGTKNAIVRKSKNDSVKT